MKENELIPHLFKTEYRKIISVLCKLFGIANIAVAEDIVNDTFLLAAESWGSKGIPTNPTAWLYTVAKNKTKDSLRRDKVFSDKVSVKIKEDRKNIEEFEVDLTDQNIQDSQLKMIFAICSPLISVEAQIGLALRILCGFGIEEIAQAFLSNKDTINKRLYRAKEKLRKANIPVDLPPHAEISDRLQPVLRTIYLLYNEGYYSSTQNNILRKDLCYEAMRLTYLLIGCEETNIPATRALMALMCFHSSRFESRVSPEGKYLLYEEQNEADWDMDLIRKGDYFLNQAAQGHKASKYHYEAAIAYWHCRKEDSKEKWENILQLYNRLLQIEYSPVAALNRTLALSKARSKEIALTEALKINLDKSHLYHALLADLYKGISLEKHKEHLNTALKLAKSEADKEFLQAKIEQLN
ncbi:MAG: sigma-70 family RNA polymerase sigma factor [Bacteroidia bacterium]|nr:sigma-70 family RNA polymerase sigma factor [Bacteroidia bacterium]